MQRAIYCIFNKINKVIGQKVTEKLHIIFIFHRIKGFPGVMTLVGQTPVDQRPNGVTWNFITLSPVMSNEWASVAVESVMY